MNQLKRQPVFDDLLGKGARIKGHEMPFFDARNSIFATQFDDMSVADLQAHLARASAHSFAEAEIRKGMATYQAEMAPRPTPPMDSGHAARAEAYDNANLASAL